MTHSNDNNRHVPAISDADLPARYHGRVTLIIEINDGDAVNVNGVEFTIEEASAWMNSLRSAAK